MDASCKILIVVAFLFLFNLKTTGSTRDCGVLLGSMDNVSCIYGNCHVSYANPVVKNAKVKLYKKVSVCKTSSIKCTALLI